LVGISTSAVSDASLVGGGTPLSAIVDIETTMFCREMDDEAVKPLTLLTQPKDKVPKNARDRDSFMMKRIERRLF
jgi:hypothetical protein